MKFLKNCEGVCTNVIYYANRIGDIYMVAIFTMLIADVESGN